MLFADTRADLNLQTADLRTTAKVFESLTTMLSMRAITAEGYISGHPKVTAKVAQLVNFSRADALACRGIHRQFIDALQQVWPEQAEDDTKTRSM